MNLQVDEAVLLAEVRRLLTEARSESTPRGEMTLLNAALKLVVLTDAQGGEEAGRLLVEVKNAQTAAMKRYA